MAKYKNFSKGVLTSEISDLATSLLITTVEVFPEGQHKVVLWSSSLTQPQHDPTREIMTIEWNAGESRYDIVGRGGEGTTEKTWIAGTNIAHILTAENIDNLLHLDQTTPQTITGDTPKLDVLKSKSILGTDSEGKIIEGAHQDISGKQDNLGFTPENSANKKTELTDSDTDYPTTKAVNTGLADKASTSHDNTNHSTNLVGEAGVINTMTEKEEPVDDDIIVIEDSEDDNKVKKVKVSSVGGGGGGEAISTMTDAELRTWIKDNRVALAASSLKGSDIVTTTTVGNPIIVGQIILDNMSADNFWKNKSATTEFFENYYDAEISDETEEVALGLRDGYTPPGQCLHITSSAGTGLAYSPWVTYTKQIDLTNIASILVRYQRRYGEFKIMIGATTLFTIGNSSNWDWNSTGNLDVSAYTGTTDIKFMGRRWGTAGVAGPTLSNIIATYS